MQRFHSLGTEVEAVQIPDELSAIMRIAAWIHTNGGRLTDPMSTFDCAFKVHTDGASVPVNVGDWVVRHAAGGEFHVWAHDKFVAAFKPMAVAS